MRKRLHNYIHLYLEKFRILTTSLRLKKSIQLAPNAPFLFVTPFGFQILSHYPLSYLKKVIS